MARFADAFIAICIVIIAMSVGAIVWLQTDLGLFAGIATTFGLVLAVLSGHFHFSRRRDRAFTDRQIDELARRTSVVAGEIAAIERRLYALETTHRRPAQDLVPISEEVELLGTLVKQIAESMADLDLRLEAQAGETAALATRLPKPAPAPVAAEPVAAAPEPAVVPRPVIAAAKPAQPRSPLVPERFAALGEAGYLKLIEDAIAQERVELALQPIVMLPQRKPRFYEAFGRLKTDRGDTLTAAEYLPMAERHGLAARIDNMVLTRAVAVLKRLAARNSDVGLIASISPASLIDSRFFREFVGFMELNRELVPILSFAFNARTFNAMGPVELDGLRQLHDLGFRFALDRVESLTLDGRVLNERGVRQVKISTEVMFGVQKSADIHPQDLATLLQRHAIELIVSDVEIEAHVLDLLDYSVRYAQGNLFAPPRPVRAEALQPEPISTASGRPAVTTPPPGPRTTPSRPTPPAPATAEVLRPLGKIERRPAPGASAVPPPPKTLEEETPERRESLLRDVLRRVDPRTARTRNLVGNG